MAYERVTTMGELLAQARKGPVVRAAVPMELGMGLPMLSEHRGELLVAVFFYRILPQKGDQSKILPPEYTMVLRWPSGRVVSLQALRYLPQHADVAYDQPIGSFRHEAIQGWSRADYEESLSRLYGMLDDLIESMFTGEAYDPAALKALYAQMLEPSLRPAYRMIGQGFYDQFCKEVP